MKKILFLDEINSFSTKKNQEKYMIFYSNLEK